jgi:molecular chaperone DnaK (HSP70)
LRGRTLSLEALIAIFLRRVRALASDSVKDDVTRAVLGRPAADEA